MCGHACGPRWDTRARCWSPHEFFSTFAWSQNSRSQQQVPIWCLLNLILLEFGVIFFGVGKRGSMNGSNICQSSCVSQCRSSLLGMFRASLLRFDSDFGHEMLSHLCNLPGKESNEAPTAPVSADQGHAQALREGRTPLLPICCLLAYESIVK